MKQTLFQYNKLTLLSQDFLLLLLLVAEEKVINVKTSTHNMMVSRTFIRDCAIDMFSLTWEYNSDGGFLVIIDTQQKILTMCMFGPFCYSEDIFTVSPARNS